MSWHLFSANWPLFRTRLKNHFPHVDFDKLADPPRDRRALVQHLADTHNLSLVEAHEALEQFLDLEDLARRVMDMRAN